MVGPIDIYSQDNSKQENTKVSGDTENTTRSSRLQRKSKFNFKGSLKSTSSDFKSKSKMIYVFYLLIAVALFALYRQGIFENIKYTPTVEKENQILEENEKLAEKELKTVKELNVKNIDEKQLVLDQALPEKNNTKQIYRLSQIAKEIGIDPKSIKIIDEPYDKEKAKQFGEALDKDIDNFLTDSYFVKYTLEGVTDKTIFFDFYSKLFDQQEFVPGEYTLTHDDKGGVLYNLSFYGYYPLTK